MHKLNFSSPHFKLWLIASMFWLAMSAFNVVGAAQFKIRDRTDGLYLLDIEGEIVRGDYEKFLSLIKKRSAFPYIISLDSP